MIQESSRRKNENKKKIDVPGWEKVEVECYSGYRSEETPRVLITASTRIFITEILARKRLRDRHKGQISEIFDCRLESGSTETLKRTADGFWWLRKRG